MLRSAINAPLTTSAGRLFDAVASLLGFSQVSSFEGEGAMLLEFAIENSDEPATCLFELKRNEPGDIEIDWMPLISTLLSDRDNGVPVGRIAAKFHDTLVEMMLAVAKESSCRNIALTGGCFQNKYLTERATQRLEESGFAVYRHQRVPPNDGGIALGQVIAAARQLRSAD
jgi:hydrogenase maturation protein HypF